MGIDPGSIKTGYALLKIKGTKITLLDSGTLSFNSKTPFLNRLPEIKIKMFEIVQKNQPVELALESLIFVKDPRALMKLAQTRGVIISEVIEFCGDNIFEYSPNLIKSTVSGHGHANKESVQKAVQMMLKINEFDSHDESDAIAVALCHALNRQSPVSMIKSKNYKPSKSGSLKANLAHKV